MSVETLNALVASINRHGVLKEVVRSQAEKLDVFGDKLIEHYDGCRSLNHNAERNIVVEGDPLLGKIVADFFENCLGVKPF